MASIIRRVITEPEKIQQPSVKYETISDDLISVFINLENNENEVYIYLSNIQYVSLLYKLYFYSIYLYINITVDFNTTSL